MTTVADVTAWLEQFAPSRLAEPWDNVGLLWGDPSAPVERVMTCLTVTPASADEAIRERAGAHRQPPSGALPGGQEDPRRLAGDRLLSGS